jgi:hypothetical protein
MCINKCIYTNSPGRADKREGGSRFPLGGLVRLCVDPDGHGLSFFGARSAPKRSTRFALFLGGSRRLSVDPEGHGLPFSGARGALAFVRHAKRSETLDSIYILLFFWVGRDGSAWIPKAMGYHSPAREARWRLFGTRSAPKRSTRFTFFSGWVASALRGSRRPWVILARRAKRAVFCSAREARWHFLCARSAPTRST